MKKIHWRLKTDEKGQAFILALILLAVGGIIIVPLLGFMATGLFAGQVIEQKVYGTYAADAGVEDAIWKIKNDQIPAIQPYSIATVNGRTVDVQIDEAWLLEGLEDPINGQLPHAELVATGRVANPATGLYEVEITYDGTVGNLFVERIGIWLPIGYGYAGSPSGITTNAPVVTPFRGGTTVIWDLTPRLKLDQGVLTSVIQQFNFTPFSDPVGDFAWVRTTRMDVYLSWDGDFDTYTITATATSASGKQTEAIAHIAKEIGSAPYSVGIITWNID